MYYSHPPKTTLKRSKSINADLGLMLLTTECAHPLTHFFIGTPLSKKKILSQAIRMTSNKSIAKALFSYPRPLQSHLQESIFFYKSNGKAHAGRNASWPVCTGECILPLGSMYQRIHQHLRYRQYKVQESSVLLVSTRFERSTWMML